MKKGYETLADFATRIAEIESKKEDFVVSSSAIKMYNDNEFEFGGRNFGINSFAHSQIASKLGIPKSYYDDMLSIPQLRTINTNAWINNRAGTKEGKDGFFIRTLEGNVRAVLGVGYKTIDNFPFLNEAVLPVLEQFKNDVQVKSYSLTDDGNLYLQVVIPSINIQWKDKNGRVEELYYGITIVNSEVGKRAYDIKDFFWRLICLNGMIAESLVRKYHTGKRMGVEDGEVIEYKNDTLAADMQAMKLRVRDILEHALNDKTKIQKMANVIAEAENLPITKTITEAVKNVTKRYNNVLNESHAESIIKTIILEKQENKWGMVNGITALAHSIESADRQYEIEKVGYDLLNLPMSEWLRIA